MKVLIIEDNLANLKLTADLLKRGGHEVLQATNATVGIKLARREQPEIILMDIHLPGMDGLTATGILKADQQTSQIPIIVWTASVMQGGNRQRIMSAGCDACIPKPVRYKDLEREMKSLLARKKEKEIKTRESKKAKILVVDPQETSRKLISLILKDEGYDFHAPARALDALQVLKEYKPDLILMDVVMPEIDGFQLVQILKHDPKTRAIPLIIVTALTDYKSRIQGLEAGAEDFLSKPFEASEFGLRIRNLLRLKQFGDFPQKNKEILEKQILKRRKKLNAAFIDILHKLTRVAEYREEETEIHVRRISFYANILAKKIGLEEEYADIIFYASPLHDVGKIVVPDDILLKPGPYTEEEREIMQTHTTMGAKILNKSVSPYLKMAQEIALNHHERWDGSGYPRGLKGEEIPLSGRIMNICDQYDSLRSKRPYKPALEQKRVLDIITKGDGRTLPGHFDPAVLKAFLSCADELENIYNSCTDKSNSMINTPYLSL